MSHFKIDRVPQCLASNSGFEIFCELSDMFYLLAKKQTLVLCFTLRYFQNNTWLNIGVTAVRKRPYFKILLKYLQNTQKQTSGLLLNFHGDSNAVLFFSKILHSEVDKCNAVTKT